MARKRETPHDAFFKETFADISKAAAELASVLTVHDEPFDWSTLRLEPGLLPTSDDDDRYSDLLFSVARADAESEVLVYVLFEHQSGDDPLMLLRMLRYMLRVWDTWIAKTKTTRPPLPPILPVVLTHDERGWRSARHFHELFPDDPGTRAIAARFIPAFEIALDDLAKVSNEQLAARGLPPAAALSLWALRDGRSPGAILRHTPFWAGTFAVLESSAEGWADAVRIFSYIGQAKGERSVDIPTFAKLIAEHNPAARQVAMNSLDRLLEQGIEKGRRLGQAEMLLELLRDKFGEVSDADVQRVTTADEETLAGYRKRLLSADSVAAVLGG
jgi:hypothetical protein